MSAKGGGLDEYESGFLACMAMVKGIIERMQEDFRPARMAMENTAAAAHLGQSANAATNLLGSVRAEMDKAGVTTLMTRREAAP